MTRELVVARFNENLHWLHEVKGWGLKVINKGEPLDPHHLPSGAELTSLPNQGREAGTYLHHIVEHYDRLADFTAFVQGHPFDHNPELLTELNLGLFGRAFSFFTIHATADELGEFGAVVRCQRDGSPHHGGLAIPQMAERHGVSVPDEGWVFSPGAQFVVSRRAIHRHPLAFYEGLLLETRDHAAGYILERLWLYLFAPSIPVDAEPSA
jgi:hypothetical protein